jgi:hypothetical protein
MIVRVRRMTARELYVHVNDSRAAGESSDHMLAR